MDKYNKKQKKNLSNNTYFNIHDVFVFMYGYYLIYCISAHKENVTKKVNNNHSIS